MAPREERLYGAMVAFACTVGGRTDVISANSRKSCCCMCIVCAVHMLHVGRLKEFMEANSRKSGLLMLFMIVEMARFPIFVVARLAGVSAAAFFLHCDRRPVHLPTDWRTSCNRVVALQC